jgi:non-specific protein-tyrosine kinase
MIRDTAARGNVRIEGQLVEHYRSLAERIRGLGAGPAGIRTLGITSCLPGEGVTTVAANLAATTAALFDGPVLLVEANFARPSLGQWLRLDDCVGLADVLMGSVEMAEAVRDSSEPNLAVLTAGTVVARTRASFDASRLQQLLDGIRDEYDLVLVDLPAATQTSPCWTIAAALDGVLLVVEAERISSRAAQNVTRRLLKVGANTLGAILNKQREGEGGWSRR